MHYISIFCYETRTPLSLANNFFYYHPQVLIYNRLDCCSERLNNVQVKVGMKPDGKGHVCGGIKVAKDKRFLEVICKQAIIGRYVTVYNTASVLSLCEVEVMGEPYQAKSKYT